VKFQYIIHNLQAGKMSAKPYKLPYPRKRIARFLIRVFGRMILPILFRLRITGRKNFPKRGPLLVVGNHTAAMEAVLLNIYSPWQIEMLSAADTPAEWITETVANLYGVIPIHRGSYDRVALESALDVLKQSGVIGIFPEGGIWQEGKKKALPGIAWLSKHSDAPVLPIGFSDTTGVINAALKLKRPLVSMHVGDLILAASIPPDKPRKKYLQEYADLVIEEVHKLVPVDQYITEPEIINEDFELEITLKDQNEADIALPVKLTKNNKKALAKFFHRPAILKIFKVNLELPVDAIQNLHLEPKPEDLYTSIQAVLTYLEEENPFLLTYRFGVKEGLVMQESLKELLQIIQWCDEMNHQITIIPTRHYFSVKENRDIIQTKQGQFKSWM
jgi:1-acyl-sn-glycerol-3-phosphate acyltransferase